MRKFRQNAIFLFFYFYLYPAKVVTDVVVNSTMFQTSKYISCYLSMPEGELDTAPLVSAILAAGSFGFSSSLRDQGNNLQVRSFQERSFTSQSWTPQSPLARGWTCSACTTSLISIHSRLVSGESVSPRTKGTANHGRMASLHHPLTRVLHPHISTPALDADQQLDLIFVPGERVLGVESTGRGSGD